jgi:autotransporter-associated beta strand protein
MRSNTHASILARAATLSFLALAMIAFRAGAQTNFARLVTDGAWTWFNDPRALIDNGNLYFGYNRAADRRSVLSALNLQSGMVTNLWSSSLTQMDDHDVPGLLVKSDGTLLAIYSRHQNDQFFTYRLSSATNPVSPGDWGPEQRNNTGTNDPSGMTYSNPYQLAGEGGKIYNFARYLNYNPNVFTSSDGGNTWSTPRILILTGTGGTIRPYVKYCSDYNQRLDFIYTDGHPDNIPTSLYHMYYQGGAFYQTDGTFLKNYSDLPILHDSGERGTVIYPYNTAAQSDPNQWIPNGRAWTWEVATQTNGNPFCVFQVKVDSVTGSSWFDARVYYYYARWTGANWQKRFIAQAGRPLYNGQPDYGAGICLDPLDPNTIYISSDAANPFDLSTTTEVPLSASQRYQIWKGVTADGGLTFAWTPMTSNSVDNLRPYVPRRNGGEPSVLWFTGTYTSYTSFDCSIVGLFTTKVPQLSLSASGTWSADASGDWSDATNWSGGIIADGSGNAADFSTVNLTADRTVNLDTSRNIGTLKFGDASGGQNWTLASTNGSVLTLSAGAPAITVLQNAATIFLPLAGTNGCTKTGPGTLILAATNSWSGTLNLDGGSTSANDGAVRIMTSGALGSVPSPVFLRNNTGLAAGSTLQLDGSAGNLSLTQTWRVSCRNNPIPWVENLAGTNTLSGAVSYMEGGTQNTFQSDAGVLVLTGPIQFQPTKGSFVAGRTNIFTGAGDFMVTGAILAATNGAPITVVKSGSGTLRVNGTLAASAVQVAGGTLGGTGIISGPVIVSPAGTVAPGNPMGAMTISNSLTNGGTLLMNLTKSGSVLANSSIKGLTTLSYGATLQLALAGDPLAPGDSFKLFAAANYIGAFASIVPAAPGPGLTWNTTGLTNGTLAVAAVARPRFSSAAISGASIVVTGTNGVQNGVYYVLASTHVALPLVDWTRLATNSFDEAGGFSFTLLLDPTVSGEYLILQLPE